MRIAYLLVAAAGVAAAASSFAQTFANGTFETGDLTGWTVQPYSTNSVGVPGSVTSIDIDGPGALLPSLAATFQVGTAVFVSGEQGGIEMIQSLNLTAGVQYTVDFDWSTQRLATGGNAQGGVFSLIVDNTALLTVAAGSVSASAPVFGHFTHSFTAGASGPVEVGIRITRPYQSPGDLSQYVDNVTMTGGGGGPTCYPNCDLSTTPPILNVTDFSCFLNAFAAGQSYANCDNSTTEPVLNVTDFSCFLNAFAAGCS